MLFNVFRQSGKDRPERHSAHSKVNSCILACCAHVSAIAEPLFLGNDGGLFPMLFRLMLYVLIHFKSRPHWNTSV